ncbi:MAG: BON domain-containing protein, partial [Gammaproteobacteria bacterium]
EIVIGAPSSLLSRSNDGLLTTRVKTRLIADSTVPATRIKVVTEDASVFLLGFVARRQGDLAAAIASETPGVKRVVKLFEYPPDEAARSH